MYFNTHTHLNSDELYEKREELIQHALAHQVKNIVVAGYDLKSSQRAVKIANEYPFVYATVGISPNDCLHTKDDELEEIEVLLQNPRVVALGEIGLDYYWDDVPRNKQKEVFIKQIKLANELDLPISIHDREAHKDTFEILKEHNKDSKIIMHCFSGSVEFARECVKEGWYLALGGVVTFKNAIKMKEVAQDIPLNKLLLETDAPYLTPVPYRGKENQPAYTKFVAEEIAKLRGITFEEVDKITTENALKVFSKISE